MRKQLKEKFILNEEEEEQEVIPAAELDQEPIAEPEESFVFEDEVPEEVEEEAFVSVINSLLVREWENIDALNGVISTFLIEKPEEEEVVKILKQIIDEKTAHVGMIQKTLGLVDERTIELILSGEEKAEDIISSDVEDEEDSEEEEKSN